MVCGGSLRAAPRGVPFASCLQKAAILQIGVFKTTYRRAAVLRHFILLHARAMSALRKWNMEQLTKNASHS